MYNDPAAAFVSVVRTHTHIYVCMYKHIHTHTHTSCPQTYTCTQNISGGMHQCTCVFLSCISYIYIYIYICVCMYLSQTYKCTPVQCVFFSSVSCTKDTVARKFCGFLFIVVFNALTQTLPRLHACSRHAAPQKYQ